MLMTTLDDAIQLLPPSLKQMLGNSRWHDDGSGLACAIENCTAKCVVDGSFHPEYNLDTAAWVFDDGFDGLQAAGCSRAVGDKHDMCSYRAKLFGIYLALQVTTVVCKHFRISSDTIEIRCDNTEALRKGLAELYFPSIQHKKLIRYGQYIHCDKSFQLIFYFVMFEVTRMMTTKLYWIVGLT